MYARRTIKARIVNEIRCMIRRLVIMYTVKSEAPISNIIIYKESAIVRPYIIRVIMISDSRTRERIKRSIKQDNPRNIRRVNRYGYEL